MMKRNPIKPVRVVPPMMEEQEVSTTPLQEWLDREKTAVVQSSVAELAVCKTYLIHFTHGEVDVIGIAVVQQDMIHRCFR